MVHRRHGLALALVSAAALTLVLTLGVGSAAAKKDRWPAADKVVLFASDGMRPDLMQEYAKHGSMPTYHELMKHGATGANGMIQAFPPNTGVGWYTIATGTYPSEHGSTNNTFFRVGDSSFNNSTSFSGTGVLQADTIANSAERAGKKVAQIDWTGGRNAAIKGPTVDFLNFFSGRGVLTTPIVPSEQAGAASFGLQYQVASFAPAAGWTNLPASSQPAKQSVLTVPTTFAAQNPTRVYDVLVYAAGTTYDRVLLVRQADGKDASKAVATLKPGVFQEIKLQGADGLIGARAGESAGFYAKVITLAGDLSSFKLYFTSVSRVIATCDSSAGGPCAGLPAGAPGEDRLEKYVADNLPTAIDADFAPEEAGIIDEDTYVQQGRDLEAAYGDAVLKYILGTLQPDTDLAMVGYPFTDEVSHQFMGLVTPKDPDGSLNPCYDVVPLFNDVQCTGRGTAGRVDAREGYIRSAYQFADAKLGMARDLMGGDPTTVRGLRPRLRRPALRHQRDQGALRHEGAQHGHEHGRVTAREQRECLELPRRRHRPGEGLLGRRHDADLRQHDAAGRDHLRGGADSGVQRVPEPDRPGEPGQAGDPQGPQEGGAPERRRLGLAAPESQR